jgi:UDP-N-acetylglucosamine 2-epimerase (non-hydrolysing)
MPEEINRVVTDRLSALRFIPSRDAADNLIAEGVSREHIEFVGNVMIDSLCWALPRALERHVPARHDLRDNEYVVATLHRPSNVDDPATLRQLLEALQCLSGERPVVFPVHPRARKRLAAAGWPLEGAGDLRLIDPVGYVEMLGLVNGAALVITDSGGLQEETTYLGVPCLTVRPNTERPITCTNGTNRLVPPRREIILAAARRAMTRRPPVRPVIERWDGRAAERIVRVLCEDGHFALDEESAREPRVARAIPQPVDA